MLVSCESNYTLLHNFCKRRFALTPYHPIKHLCAGPGFFSSSGCMAIMFKIAFSFPASNEGYQFHGVATACLIDGI